MSEQCPSGATGSQTGTVFRALALVESGILVNGSAVTDLLSGFTVSGDIDGTAVSGDIDGTAVSGDIDGTAVSAGAVPRDSPEWRRTGIALTRLEAVRELVSEVLTARAADPELTSPNPLVPRTRFPWGVGEPHTDIIVVGDEAAVTASYLRSVGLRARVVDPTDAVKIAADLAMARAELEEIEASVSDGSRSGSRSADRDTAHVRPAYLSRPSDPDVSVDDGSAGHRVRTVAAVMTGLVVLVLCVFGVVSATGGQATSGDRALPDGVQTQAGSTWPPAGTVGSTTVGEQPRGDGEGLAPTSASAESVTPGEWNDPVRHGSHGDDPRVSRADVPVTVGLEGWTISEATRNREIWMSEDPDMRILVAAKPAPVGTQDQLDARMLTALEKVPGVRVLSRSPVDYEESTSRSVTRWQVRLIDGHQVSVGCQYRPASGDVTADRTAVCDRFTATVRVG
ncbi:type VII secretion-associated protein [Corynebacterium provencense]|uniref:type VII secretion-associated protein n=1 Tax=Corynebacterium provencense TaxID=1737425 RepID=UPI00082DAC41|nr:type VII secretion-associated protein [Corynebacterium provencense]